MADIISSGVLTGGQFSTKWESGFAKFTGANHAVSCSNGTAALELILRGLGIVGKSIIVPTNTFLATALSVIHSGNQVIFADSDPATLSLDVDDVAKRITPDTAAIITVHIGGIISPTIYELQALCRKNNIHLIEDAAHAHGSKIDQLHAGTIGVAGAFSFFPTKVLTTGEGGMVVTNNDELSARMKMLRNQGKNPSMGNRISELGHNFRASEFTALVGAQQMTKSEWIVSERQRVAKLYDTALQTIDGIDTIRLPEHIESSYYKYVVFLDPTINKAEIKESMLNNYEVQLTGEVYAELCHLEPIWQRYTYCGQERETIAPTCTQWPNCSCIKQSDTFPGAKYISEHHLCLPIYPDLSSKDASYVIESLRSVINDRK